MPRPVVFACLLSALLLGNAPATQADDDVPEWLIRSRDLAQQLATDLKGELQRAVLEQFADDLASGNYAMPLEAAVEIKRGGKLERRYMRAIPMEEVCLTCHGKVLAPAIAASYPEDQATGFEPGQLRGAVSVRWPPVGPDGR